MSAPWGMFALGVFAGFVGTLGIVMLFSIVIGFIEGRTYGDRHEGSRFDEEENGGEA